MKTYLQECLNYHSNVKPITCLWLTIVMLYTLAQTSTALPVSRNALIKDNVQLEEDILDTYLSVHRINSFMKSVKELHRLGGIDSRDFAISDPVNPSLPISFIKRSEGAREKCKVVCHNMPMALWIRCSLEDLPTGGERPKLPCSCTVKCENN